MGSEQTLYCTNHQTTSSFVADFDYFALMSSHKVTVSGLSAGQKVRLYDMLGNMLAEATAMSSVVLDISGATSSRFRSFEITDTDGTTVLYRTQPSESFYGDIWGGDSYQWAKSNGAVGGAVSPVNKLTMLAPYLMSAAVVAAVVTLFATRRRSASVQGKL